MFDSFFTYQVKEVMESLLNSLEDYVLAPFFGVGVPNLCPAAAPPAGPAWLIFHSRFCSDANISTNGMITFGQSD